MSKSKKRKKSKKRTIPRIARATNPQYPDRLAVLFINERETAVLLADSAEQRDALIASEIAAGRAEPIHVHCSDPKCRETFPVVLLDEDLNPFVEQP